MADTTSRELQVGEAVYRPYTPTQYGKITERLDSGVRALWRNLTNAKQITTQDVFYRIKWRDGTESVEWWLDAPSLRLLTENHEKVAANHRKRLAKAEAL